MSQAERAISLSTQREGSNVPLVLRPQSLAEYMDLARMLAESDIVPTAYKGKAGNVLVALQMGAEVGLHPVQALQSIAVINGKPSIYGDAGLGIVMASGQLEDIEETDDGETATCRLKRKGRPTEVIRSFSMAMARAAQVYESNNQGGGSWRSLSERATWKSYPQRMRQMRARWWALRDLFPDVLKGLAGREEIEDYGEEPKIGAEAARRVGPEVESMSPRRASEAAAAGQGHEADRGTTEEAGKGQQEPVSTAGGSADGPAAEPDATAKKEEGASNEPPKAGDEPARGPEPRVGETIAEQLNRGEQTAGGPPTSRSMKPTRFAIGKQNFETAGITKEQMLATFKLAPRVDKKHGKDYCAGLILKEFGVTSRTELTEEAAGHFIIRLQEILGEV